MPLGPRGSDVECVGEKLVCLVHYDTFEHVHRPLECIAYCGVGNADSESVSEPHVFIT